MGIDLDRWIEKVKKCESLNELELQSLCEYVLTRFQMSLFSETGRD